MQDGTLELVAAIEWSDWDCPRPGAPSVDRGEVNALFLRDREDRVVEAWFPLRKRRSDGPPQARVEEIGHQQLALRVEDEATTLVAGPEATPEGRWERVWLMQPGPDVSWLSQVGMSDLTIVLQPRLEVFEIGPTLRAALGGTEGRDFNAAVEAYQLRRLEVCFAALAEVEGLRRLRVVWYSSIDESHRLQSVVHEFAAERSDLEELSLVTPPKQVEPLPFSIGPNLRGLEWTTGPLAMNGSGKLRYFAGRLASVADLPALGTPRELDVELPPEQIAALPESIVRLSLRGEISALPPALSRLPKLESLTVVTSRNLGDVESLRGCRRLRHLRVEADGLVDVAADLSPLARLPALTHLTLDTVYRLVDAEALTRSETLRAIEWVPYYDESPAVVERQALDAAALEAAGLANRGEHPSQAQLVRFTDLEHQSAEGWHLAQLARVAWGDGVETIAPLLFRANLMQLRGAIKREVLRRRVRSADVLEHVPLSALRSWRLLESEATFAEDAALEFLRRAALGGEGLSPEELAETAERVQDVREGAPLRRWLAPLRARLGDRAGALSALDALQPQARLESAIFSVVAACRGPAAEEAGPFLMNDLLARAHPDDLDELADRILALSERRVWKAGVPEARRAPDPRMRLPYPIAVGPRHVESFHQHRDRFDAAVGMLELHFKFASACGIALLTQAGPNESVTSFLRAGRAKWSMGRWVECLLHVLKQLDSLGPGAAGNPVVTWLRALSDKGSSIQDVGGLAAELNQVVKDRNYVMHSQRSPDELYRDYTTRATELLDALVKCAAPLAECQLVRIASKHELPRKTTYKAHALTGPFEPFTAVTLPAEPGTRVSLYASPWLYLLPRGADPLWLHPVFCAVECEECGRDELRVAREILPVEAGDEVLVQGTNGHEHRQEALESVGQLDG